LGKFFPSLGDKGGTPFSRTTMSKWNVLSSKILFGKFSEKVWACVCVLVACGISNFDFNPACICMQMWPETETELKWFFTIRFAVPNVWFGLLEYIEFSSRGSKGFTSLLYRMYVNWLIQKINRKGFSRKHNGRLIKNA